MNRTLKKPARALCQFALLNIFCLLPMATQATASEPVVFPKLAVADDALQGIEYASVEEMAKALDEGRFSSKQLTGYLISRASLLDSFGPTLDAVIEFNREALEIAGQLDEERAAGKLRGPLHGIPVLLKDNIHSADGMQTAAGSLAMVGQPAPDDAFIVARLREQGAIVLGKTNMDEWANFRGDGLSPGWSGRGGQSRNPHKLDGEVCGSSTGSAVAVAAGFAPLALGTDTFGSITCPASLNGIVGMKPSIGLLSRSGIIPASPELDSAGPMTRSVRDAALMLNAMVALDPRDPATLQAPAATDYTALLTSDALRGKRLGYPQEYAPGGEYSDPRLDRALELMRAAGAELVPVQLATPVWYSAESDHLQRLFTMNIKQVLGPYLASRPGLQVATLPELVAFNERHPTGPACKAQGSDGQPLEPVSWIACNQNLLKAANALVLDEKAREALAQSLQAEARKNIDALLTGERLDALIGDPDWRASLEFGTTVLAGYPGISVPSGMDEQGLPTALYFYGGQWRDAQLLAIAHGYEQASQARVNPDFE